MGNSQRTVCPQKWAIDINTRLTVMESMATSQTENKEKKPDAQAKGAAENKPATSTKVVVATFDKLSENDQVRILEQLAADKTKAKDIDSALLFQRLRDKGIGRIPDDELINTALEARRSFAQGAIGFIHGRDLCRQTYEMAVKTYGWTPKEARAFVVVFVTDNGRLLSERTVKRALPDEAKDMHKDTSAEQKAANEQRKQAAEATKTPEEREGLTGIYCPVMWCEKIAEFALKKQACMIFISDKQVKKVKAAVVTEQVVKENGVQKTKKIVRKAAEAAPTA